MQQSYQSVVPSTNADILDLLGLGVTDSTNSSSLMSTVPATQYSATTIPVYSRDNIEIKCIVKKEFDHAVVTVKTTNNSLNMLEKYMFQVRSDLADFFTFSTNLLSSFLWQSAKVAVPKAYSIQMMEPSSTIMLPGETVVQDIHVARIYSAVTSSLRMKVRFSYEIGNYSVMEQADVNEFPPDLFDWSGLEWIKSSKNYTIAQHNRKRS